jgi:hypothetical protein
MATSASSSMCLASDLDMNPYTKQGAAALPYSDTLDVNHREEVEQERREIEQAAEKLLDHDAIASVDDAWKAVRAIEENHLPEGRRLLQQALSKMRDKIRDDLARDPARVSVPVGLEVKVLDNAPADRELILDLADQAALAMAKRIYSEAREVLQRLASEIRVHTLNVQLQAFANSLYDAARLMDNGQSSKAVTLLRHSLASIVQSIRVIPIPLVLAREAIREAEIAQQQRNKTEALNLLAKAEGLLQRAKDLGYMDQAERLEEVREQIKQMKKLLKSGTNSGFSHLKATLAGILKD